MTAEKPPFSDEILRLLVAEREAPGPAVEVTDRMLSRLASVLLPPPSGGGLDGGSSSADGGGGGPTEASGSSGGADGAPPDKGAEFNDSGGGGSSAAPATSGANSEISVDGVLGNSGTVGAAGTSSMGTGTTIGVTQGAVGSALGTVLRSGAGLWTQKIPLALSMLGLGAAGGVAVHSRIVAMEEARAPVHSEPHTASSPRDVPAGPAVLPSEPALPEIATPPPPAPPAVPATEPIAPVEPRAAEPGSILRDRTGATERVFIERARTALSRRDGTAALAALFQHQREFPRGTLTEEREALMIQALASIGRLGEAQERAHRFLSRYPRSLFRPVIERSVRLP